MYNMQRDKDLGLSFCS